MLREIRFALPLLEKKNLRRIGAELVVVIGQITSLLKCALTATLQVGLVLNQFTHITLEHCIDQKVALATLLLCLCYARKCDCCNGAQH